MRRRSNRLGAFLFNCLFWGLFAPILFVYVGGSVLIDYLKVAFGHPPDWWRSS